MGDSWASEVIQGGIYNATFGWAGGIWNWESHRKEEAAEQGKTYDGGWFVSGYDPTAPPKDPNACDRDTFLGSFGMCELQKFAETAAPVVTVVAVVAGFGIVGITTIALLNATGTSDVLRGGGKAVARALR